MGLAQACESCSFRKHSGHLLEPGEAYWFLADGPAPLSGGFSLSAPISVPLKAGWNTVVYIGATAPAADAFASLGTSYKEIYAWDAPAAG